MDKTGRAVKLIMVSGEPPESITLTMGKQTGSTGLLLKLIPRATHWYSSIVLEKRINYIGKRMKWYKMLLALLAARRSLLSSAS